MNGILVLIGLTLLPFLELRASIPYGILALKMNWISVFLICVITNMILGPIVYVLLDKVIHVFLKVRFIEKIYNYYVERTQKRISKYIDRWGLLGVAIFIGIPLPGSGSYTGALGSYLIGLKFRKFIIANILGVLIAGIIVTLIVLSGNSLFNFLVKVI